MILTFKNVFVISESIERKSGHDFFWPNEVRRFKRQALIDQNKREGWYCRFLNDGLLLESQIIISEKDYKDWPASHITANPNITQSHLEFHKNYELNLPEPQLYVRHSAADAELVRKKIYISEKFRELAHEIYASQYFEADTEKNEMNYILGFERKLSDTDRVIVEKIKCELKEFNQLTFLS